MQKNILGILLAIIFTGGLIYVVATRIAQPKITLQETTPNVVSYSSQIECEAKTGKQCAFTICDVASPGETIEETCGKGFKKGWMSRSGTFEISGDWKTYQNVQYGFTFQYPASYKEVPPPGMVKRPYGLQVGVNAFSYAEYITPLASWHAYNETATDERIDVSVLPIEKYSFINGVMGNEAMYDAKTKKWKWYGQNIPTITAPISRKIASGEPTFEFVVSDAGYSSAIFAIPHGDMMIEISFRQGPGTSREDAFLPIDVVLNSFKKI